jgi:sugar O-acyltransferase (sialic acid O-acetyltransferase NeuD family)
MNERWLVWGGGGHGAVVAAAIRAGGDVVVGFADQVATGDGFFTEASLKASFSQGHPLPGGASRVALGIGENLIRQSVLQLMEAEQSPAIVHPTAWVEPDATIGWATVILPHALVHSRARIGAAVIINSGAIIEHDCVIGDAVHMSPGAVATGGVVIDDGAWVGAGAVILPGIRIGASAVVGAGAVVTRDVPPRITVAGNPARELTGPRP